MCVIILENKNIILPLTCMGIYVRAANGSCTDQQSPTGFGLRSDRDPAGENIYGHSELCL